MITKFSRREKQNANFETDKKLNATRQKMEDIANNTGQKLEIVNKQRFTIFYVLSINIFEFDLC